MIMGAMARMRAFSGIGVGLITLVVWALAAGGLMYWLLHPGDSGSQLRTLGSGASDVSLSDASTAQVARALGAVADTPAQPAGTNVLGHLRLEGVLTYGPGGAAAIAVNGQPAKAVRVGSTVEGGEHGWTLRAVEPHSIVLAQGAREEKLELPSPDERSRARGVAAPQATAPAGTPAAAMPAPARLPGGARPAAGAR